MTTQTTTREINAAKKITVSLERGTWEETIRLGGMECGTKTHLVDRLEIALWDGEKKIASGSSVDPLPARHTQLAQARAAGCTGLIGNHWFTRLETETQIRQAINELEIENPKTAEMISLEQEAAEIKRIGEENLARMEAEQRERERHPGWCKRHQSYCYGDCRS